MIDEAAIRYPDRVAVRSEYSAITYSDLIGFSNYIAQCILELRHPPRTPIAICMRRGVEMVPAILGVLKSGGVCVPLDPDHPDQRLRWILGDTSALVLLTDDSMSNRFADLSVDVLVVGDPSDRTTASAPAWAPRSKARATDLSYILYTSGSTGAPKGVEIEFQALSDNAVKTADLLSISAEDVVLQFASISFASALGQIFAPLIRGATVLVRGRHYSGRGLVQYIESSRVTILWLTPSVLSHLISGAEADARFLGKPLRMVRSGGEALTSSLISRWFNRSDAPLINVYGPTEAVQDITAKRYTSPETTVSLGRPIFDSQVLVLDDAGDPVGVDTPGTLYFSTPGMARGYLNQPALTEERFVTRVIRGSATRFYNSGDIVRMNHRGELEYVGRKDGQLKIRGVRIEVGEVESRLMSHPKINEAIVSLYTKSGADYLVGFYVSSIGGPLDPIELTRWCARTLPATAVPTKYVCLEKIPLTVNGKTDRTALKDRL